MGDSKQNRHKNSKPKVELTPEQIAANKAAQELRAAEAKAEQERLHLYGAEVEKMSHRRLRRELTKSIRRQYTKIGKGVYEPIAGPDIIAATIALIVLDNTNTPENPWGKLSSYPR